MAVISQVRQFTKRQVLNLHRLNPLIRKLQYKKTTHPFLCVITPVHNPSLPSVKQLVLDMKKQSFGDFTHILISNGVSHKIRSYINKLNISDPRFVYIELKHTPTPNFAALMSNLGTRRDYCLRKIEADRYLFLDADTSIIDTCYFSKLFFAHTISHKDILVTNSEYHGEQLPIHPINKEGQIQISNFCITGEVAKKYRYPTKYNVEKSQGNDWVYWQKIKRRSSILFLDFLATSEGSGRSYKRATDKKLEEQKGGSLISVFGNTFTQHDADSIHQVLQTHLVGKGSVVTDFETKFKSHIGFKYAVATNSCTNSFWLLLKALNFKKSDEIIIASTHFFGVKNVLDLLQIKYKVVDVDEIVPNINIEKMISSVTKSTRAIIGLDYGGYPLNVVRLKRALSHMGRKDILLILDAANSPFTKVNSKFVARNYDYALYSFDMNKIMVTGDGGMILSNNQHVMDRVRALSYYGILDKHTSGFSKSSGGFEWWKVNASEPSLKLAMNNITAALGISQLIQIEQMLVPRNKIKELYYTKLQKLVDDKHIVLPPRDKNIENANYLFWLVVKNKQTRDDLAYSLLSKNIYSTVKYQPLASKRQTPIAWDFFDRSLCIPFNQNLSESTVDYIVSQIIEYFYE